MRFIFPFLVCLTSVRAVEYQWTTLAGKAGVGLEPYVDGFGGAARFKGPEELTVAGNGNIYVADTYNDTVRIITPEGLVTTPPGAREADLRYPRGIAVDAGGNIYVSDYIRHIIRKITPAGLVSTLAGKSGAYGSTNGSGAAARFDTPEGLTINAAGILFLADQSNQLIRRITPAGVVTTFSGQTGSPGFNDGSRATARLSDPGSVAVDGAGNVFVTDPGYSTLRKVLPSGAVMTLAGVPAYVGGPDDGVGTFARFNKPEGVAVDASGNVFVADSANHTIRKMTPDREVTTIGGRALYEGSLDGVGSTARFSSPRGIAVAPDGTLYVADSWNSVIRKGTVVAGLSSIENWRLAHFGISGNTGNAADGFDYDHDGLTNLVEYAFGLDPKSSSSSQLPEWKLSGDLLSVTFSQPEGVGGIYYNAEYTTDPSLGTWQPMVDVGGDKHFFGAPTSGHKMLFVRFRISKASSV